MVSIYTYQKDWNSAISMYEEILQEQKQYLSASQASFGGAFAGTSSNSSHYKAVHDTLISMSICYQELDLQQYANHCRQEASLIAQEGGLLQDLGNTTTAASTTS